MKTRNKVNDFGNSSLWKQTRRCISGVELIFELITGVIKQIYKKKTSLEEDSLLSSCYSILEKDTTKCLVHATHKHELSSSFNITEGKFDFRWYENQFDKSL
jgi:hypothetical protein